MFRRKTTGFTLVELMLAMTFIAILLVSIAMLSIYLSTLYTRGSTMKDINQAGTEIASDIKRSIAAAPDNFPQQKTYKLSPAPNDKVKVLCTGSVTYLVNMGSALEHPVTSNPIKYSDGVPARIAKIDDTAGTLCSLVNNSTVSGAWPSAGRKISSANARELLSQESAHTLSVWDVAANMFAPSGSPELTTVNITIGTSESADIDFPTSIDFPGDTDSPGDYAVCSAGNGSEWCGINTFEIVGRSGNGTEL